MVNKFKLGDMIKTPGNPDFRYGICHINTDTKTVNVLIVANYLIRTVEKGCCFTHCRTDNWVKIKRTKKRKKNFITELNAALKLKLINNLDYIETMYNLKNE